MSDELYTHTHTHQKEKKNEEELRSCWTELELLV